MSKQIIGALFDDGFGSGNQFGKENIISIGINENKEGNNYYKIDLSITNFDLIKQLEKLPKPDIIIAHPPCESWSIADCGGAIYNNDLTYKNKDYYDEYNSKAHKVKTRNFINKEQGRIMGESTGGGLGK